MRRRLECDTRTLLSFKLADAMPCSVARRATPTASYELALCFTVINAVCGACAAGSSRARGCRLAMRDRWSAEKVCGAPPVHLTSPCKALDCVVAAFDLDQGRHAAVLLAAMHCIHLSRGRAGSAAHARVRQPERGDRLTLAQVRFF